MNLKIDSFTLKELIESFRTFLKVFKLLWSIRKLYLILIAICYIINGIIPAISILTMQSLLNTLQKSVDKDFIYVMYPLIIYISVNVSGYLLQQFNVYLQGIFRIDINYKISVLILEKAQTLSLSHFENSETYDKLRRAQNESIERPYIIFTLVLSLISKFLGFISSLAILLYWKSWLIFLILVTYITSTFYMSKVGYLQYKIDYERSQERRKSWYFSYLLTNDIAFKEVKIYRLSEYFISRYKNITKGFIEKDKDIIKKRTILSIIFEIFDQILGGFILYQIVRSAYIGEILIGNTVAYISSISNIKGNLEGILGSISVLYQSNLYIKQLFEFLEMPIRGEMNITDNIQIKEINTIEFKNVSFKYPNRQKYALKDISIKLKRGENISLVGENGSGKTTLIKLLLGLYNDYEGEILINNVL